MDCEQIVVDQGENVVKLKVLFDGLALCTYIRDLEEYYGFARTNNTYSKNIVNIKNKAENP